ncbi:uncharacterized protein LOC121678015 [Alosa sapidissima]|uniref:uncharacterized protein LOC121678015 n=1 Tax=Alosa sapidissima TaxID=34773 RepID=UPI001C0979A8|nr:uncharacterized protein LOC121678015 [Alosa sapidissima]
MGASFFKAFEHVAEAFMSVMQEIAEKIEQIAMECTDTSNPDAIGFAFRGISEAPADPLFEKYLSLNSSQHLDCHYTSVRDSFSPEQVSSFDQSLRDTLGGSGTVAFGGVGVVALALAMLFDVLAAQMKGQMPLPDPMQQIFNGEGEALSKMRAAISDCLNRLPRSGNRKRKMKLQAHHCQLQVRNTLHTYALEVLEKAQVTGNYVNAVERNHLLNAYLLYAHLAIHYNRIESSEEISEPLTATDKNSKKMLLLYVFAPNVTYAMQNWEEPITNMNISCVQPPVMESISLLSEGQTTFVSTLRDRKELIKQHDDFAISK